MNPDYPFRKLRRGLKDVSPLFRSEPVATPVPWTPPQPEAWKAPEDPGSRDGLVQCLSIFSPDTVGDTLFLSTFLASQMSSSDCACTLISLEAPSDLKNTEPSSKDSTEEVLANNLKRWVLPWNQMEKIWHPTSLELRGRNRHQPMAVFLDFEYSHMPCFEKAVAILDKCIVVVRPTFESLSEAYKMIKATLALNQRLEFFLLVDTDPADGRGGILFERFSSLVAERLGVHVAWLGYLHFTNKSHQPFVSQLVLDPLRARPSWRDVDSVEKEVLVEVAQTFAHSMEGAV